MMSNKKEKLVTPKAEVVWAFLDEPSTKFNPDGVYAVSLAFDGKDKDFKKLQQMLKERRDDEFEKWRRDNPKQAKAAKAAPVCVKETDEDGIETGRVLFNFKMNAKGTSRRTGKEFTMQPDIFDAKGIKIEKPPAVGGGSVVRVAYETFGAYVASSKQYYLSLQMRAVQILELVEAGNRSAESYGFTEEDGFTATPRTSQFDDDAEEGYDAEDVDEDEDDDQGDY